MFGRPEVECPPIISTDVDVSWLFAAFDPGGEVTGETNGRTSLDRSANATTRDATVSDP